MIRFTLPIEKLNSSAACGIVSNPTYAHGATATIASIPFMACFENKLVQSKEGPHSGARFDQWVMGLNNAEMVITRKADLNVILRHIKLIDPDAFLSVGSATGVYGKGFDTIKTGKK